MDKFTTTALKFRQRTIELKEARSRIVFLPDYKPTSAQVATTAATAKKKVGGGPVCTARTLEGRQCTFKAMAGGCFCKKHGSMV